MVNGNNGSWKVSQAKFQGYMKASMENTEKRLDKIEIKLDANSNIIERLKIKMGIIAGIAGIIFATAWHYIRRFF